MEEKYILYLHINKTNDKIYVGITKFTNPERRWCKGKGYKHSVRFKHAIEKYGWDNFDHIVLRKDISKELAITLEKQLITYYKSQNKSYNIGNGGEGSDSFSEETREKLRQYIPWIKGKKQSPEALVLMALREKRPCKEETKQKIRDTHALYHRGKGRYVPRTTIQALIQANSKPVYQMDKNENIIQEFKSSSDAERFLGVKGNHVGCCCLGKRQSAYGYKWKYKI